ESTPEVASEPENETENGWLYHPFASELRSGAALTAGGVASYFSWNEPGALTFPAISRHVPVAVAVALSGPAKPSVVHEAIPEFGSDRVNVMLTEWVYQPFLSGPRSGLAPVTVGGSGSMKMPGNVTVPGGLPHENA